FYTEANARVQADALRIGAPTFLRDREAISSSESIAGQIARAWDLWSRAASDAG
ncbi:MAG: hypothetical protein JWM87_1647, partial [Candidatus Eremiobacteraeota bacterium]|nr:hypothetical protein [Candidatus Eremiobacteraeota bacterium]